MLCAFDQFGALVSAVNNPSPAKGRTRRSAPFTALSKRVSSHNSSTSSKPDTKMTGLPRMSSQKIGPSVFWMFRRLATGAFEVERQEVSDQGLGRRLGNGIETIDG